MLRREAAAKAARLGQGRPPLLVGQIGRGRGKLSPEQQSPLKACEESGSARRVQRRGRGRGRAHCLLRIHSGARREHNARREHLWARQRQRRRRGGEACGEEPRLEAGARLDRHRSHRRSGRSSRGRRWGRWSGSTPLPRAACASLQTDCAMSAASLGGGGGRPGDGGVAMPKAAPQRARGRLSRLLFYYGGQSVRRCLPKKYL